MSGVNKVILVGNLGKDPEVQYLESGVALARFSLATTENYKDKTGNRVDQTEWHNVVLWRGRAEVAEKYLKKGSKIYLEGKIRTRSWDDKDGNKRYTTEVVGDNFVMLDRRSDNEGQSYNAPPSESKPIAEPVAKQTEQQTEQSSNPQEYEDDLPF